MVLFQIDFEDAFKSIIIYRWNFQCISFGFNFGAWWSWYIFAENSCQLAAVWLKHIRNVKQTIGNLTVHMIMINLFKIEPSEKSQKYHSIISLRIFHSLAPKIDFQFELLNCSHCLFDLCVLNVLTAFRRQHQSNRTVLYIRHFSLATLNDERECQTVLTFH